MTQLNYLNCRMATRFSLPNEMSGLIFEPIKSDPMQPTARHRYAFFRKELCCPQGSDARRTLQTFNTLRRNPASAIKLGFVFLPVFFIQVRNTL